MKESVDIRESIVEGLFYPSDAEKLQIRVEELLKANPQKRRDGDYLILPHGGWDYTGDYLAAGFNALPEKSYKRAVIISNVHREFTNTVTLPVARYFRLLDKKIKVDLDAIKKVEKVGKKIVKSNTPHMEEHSIETVLPFLNYLYPDIKIVPILLGKSIVSLVRSVSTIIEQLKDDDTLVIVSSNFSSYEKESRSKEFGELGVKLTTSRNPGELIEMARTNKLQTCGAGAIASLQLLGDYSEITVLKEGLTPQTPLSGGKATYYASLILEKKESK